MLDYGSAADPAWSSLGVGTFAPSCIPQPLRETLGVRAPFLVASMVLPDARLRGPGPREGAIPAGG
jgi:hypothetical protein